MTEPAPISKARRRLTAIVVASALFLENIDSTAVATALPSMARDFGLPLLHLSAAITSYLVALTVFIPISGWVADRLGAKRVFFGAIALFTLASILCALSSGLAQLVGGRILQGMAGAMMVPVGRLLILKNAKREEILDALTWLTMPAMLGPLLGPPLGGFLTDAFSWRSVFWINVPLGLLGMWLTWRFIDPTEPSSPPAPDLRGFALSGLSIALFMVGVETVGRGLLPQGVAELLLVTGVVLFVLAYVHCRRTPHPAIDFSLFSIPSFNASTLVGGIFRFGAGAMPFLVPLTLQISFGLSAAHSGLISLASALGSLCMKPLSRTALRLLRARTVLVLSSIAASLVLCMCAAITHSWPAYAIFGVLLLSGVTRSLCFATMNAMAFADIPPTKLSAATSLQGTAQHLARAAGVALAALAMQVSMSWAGRSEPSQADFGSAFIVLAVLVSSAVPILLFMDREIGAGLVQKKIQEIR